MSFSDLTEPSLTDVSGSKSRKKTKLKEHFIQGFCKHTLKIIYEILTLKPMQTVIFKIDPAIIDSWTRTFFCPVTSFGDTNTVNTLVTCPPQCC